MKVAKCSKAGKPLPTLVTVLVDARLDLVDSVAFKGKAYEEPGMSSSAST